MAVTGLTSDSSSGSSAVPPMASSSSTAASSASSSGDSAYPLWNMCLSADVTLLVWGLGLSVNPLPESSELVYIGIASLDVCLNFCELNCKNPRVKLFLWCNLSVNASTFLATAGGGL